jgi:hypothetical protein
MIKWNERRTPLKFGEEGENSRAGYGLNWSGYNLAKYSVYKGNVSSFHDIPRDVGDFPR